jgi:hypothetical protein
MIAALPSAGFKQDANCIDVRMKNRFAIDAGDAGNSGFSGGVSI